MYMHFIVPGGVTALDYAVIATRWTDPTWGVYWRTFDLLLLILGVTHSANGLRKVLDDHVYHSGGRRAAKLTLYLVVIFWWLQAQSLSLALDQLLDISIPRGHGQRGSKKMPE
jgi:succinate dehydrogenase hydrophobic anchor subunit